jgi:hypothetical protein
LKIFAAKLEAGKRYDEISPCVSPLFVSILHVKDGWMVGRDGYTTRIAVMALLPKQGKHGPSPQTRETKRPILINR